MARVQTIDPPQTATPSRPGRLELLGIYKRFNGSGVTLENVSLRCEPGEFVVVVGPSGCGKTSLLNIAAGMMRADEGKATLDGKKISAPGPERAMVFQDHGLFPWLDAAQNVEFGLKMTGVPASERTDRVNAALKMVHLAGSARKLVHEL